MLVLQRRLGERVLISEEVTITVLSIKDKQIELGISAPATMRIAPEQQCTRLTRLWSGFQKKEVA